MKKESLVCFLLILTINTYAQKSNFIGRYNGSKPELAQELLLLPDGHFIFSLSYGAVDKLISGQWTVNGDKIRLLEKKVAMEPFIVYGRHSNTLKKGKLFIFKEYAQNTSVVFSFTDTFDPGSFKLLHLQDQTTFSHTDQLNVISKPVTTFFLSKSANMSSELNDKVKVYEITPASEWNEFMLFYNGEAEIPAFTIEASLKDSTLMIEADGRKGVSFGRREELPANFNIDNYKDYFKTGTGLPDTLVRRDSLGNQVTYHLVKSKGMFDSVLIIKEDDAYFKPESDADVTPVDHVVTPTAVWPPAPPVISGTKAKGKKQRKN
ncbi:hypothetical protein TH53_22640 [Pedobacter lusitanus]|uniref:Uncharacterized protein n=1 Tax=Pedobacter lusitanus TaxID=1503925 RepID=A0A0D0GCH0_9SPHI|nr:hypothetical protein [Pedobacter lusitanus]KIO75057.1 hypothetical protein TH53_22640 [Pedobacter lusitanus]